MPRAVLADTPRGHPVRQPPSRGPAGRFWRAATVPPNTRPPSNPDALIDRPWPCSPLRSGWPLIRLALARSGPASCRPGLVQTRAGVAVYPCPQGPSVRWRACRCCRTGNKPCQTPPRQMRTVCRRTSHTASDLPLASPQCPRGLRCRWSGWRPPGMRRRPRQEGALHGPSSPHPLGLNCPRKWYEPVSSDLAHRRPVRP